MIQLWKAPGSRRWKRERAYMKLGSFDRRAAGRESQILTRIWDLDVIVKSIRAYVQLLRCLLFTP
jgi:hypothetical protein